MALKVKPGTLKATLTRKRGGGASGDATGNLKKFRPGLTKPKGVLRPGLKYSRAGKVVQDRQIARVEKRNHRRLLRGTVVNKPKT